MAHHAFSAERPLRVGLVGGRHSIPEVDTYLITGPSLPPGRAGAEMVERSARRLARQVRFIDLYLTGYPVAYVAAVETLRSLGVRVRIFLWDHAASAWFTWGDDLTA